MASAEAGGRLDRLPGDAVERGLDARSRDPGRVRQLEGDAPDRGAPRAATSTIAPAKNQRRHRLALGGPRQPPARPSTSSTRSRPALGHRASGLEGERPDGRPPIRASTTCRTPTARRKRRPSASTPRSKQLHRAVEGARDEAGVAVDERTPVREAVEHRDACRSRRGAGRGRRPSCPASQRAAGGGARRSARGAAARLADSTIISTSAARTTSRRRPDEREAGEHREREHRDEREARERAHPAHEDDVLVQEAVEGGLGAEREDDGHGRRDDRHRAVAPRGGARGRRCRGRARTRPGNSVSRTSAGSSRRCVSGAPEPRSPPPRRTAAWPRSRDRLERELLALERPHAQVRARPPARGAPPPAGRPAARRARSRGRAGRRRAPRPTAHRERGGRDRAEVDRGEPLQGEHQARPRGRGAACGAPRSGRAPAGRAGRKTVTCACRCDRRVQRCGPAAKNAPATKAASRSPLARRTRRCAPEAGEERGSRAARGCTRGRARRPPGAARRAAAGSSRFSENARASGSGWKAGASKTRRGLGHSAWARPGQDPGVQAPVGAVHRPRVREVAHQRPAHHGQEHGVAGGRERDLGGGHRPRRRGATRRVPRGRPREGRGEEGHGESERVGEEPRPGGARLPEVPRRDHLAAAVRGASTPGAAAAPGRRARGAPRAPRRPGRGRWRPPRAGDRPRPRARGDRRGRPRPAPAPRPTARSAPTRARAAPRPSAARPAGPRRALAGPVP